MSRRPARCRRCRTAGTRRRASNVDELAIAVEIEEPAGPVLASLLVLIDRGGAKAVGVRPCTGR
ncbi:hypothetical protein [Azospirillum endophyticum]